MLNSEIITNIVLSKEGQELEIKEELLSMLLRYTPEEIDKIYSSAIKEEEENSKMLVECIECLYMEENLLSYNLPINKKGKGNSKDYKFKKKNEGYSICEVFAIYEQERKFKVDCWNSDIVDYLEWKENKKSSQDLF